MLHIYWHVHLLLAYFVSSAPIVNYPVYHYLQQKVMGFSYAMQRYVFQRATHHFNC